MAGTLLWSSATAGEHTGGFDRSAWVTNGSLPFAWGIRRSLPSVQNYRPYIVFSSPMRKQEPTKFSVYGWLLELTYFHFFPVICWSYLRTEISVTLSIGNKLYSRCHLYLSLSCETTLLMLSRDCIESAKFIYGTLSLAKLVYYKTSNHGMQSQNSTAELLLYIKHRRCQINSSW